MTISAPLKGATVSIVRSSVSGSEKLIKNIRISVQDALGPVAFVPNSKFLAGVSINEINTAYDQLGSANGTGISRFALTLDLFSPPADGAGRVTTVISMVAASIM